MGIDGVITFWDDVENDVLLAAKIRDKYDLKGMSVDIVNNLKDKFQLRKFCKEHGVLSPNYCKIKTYSDLDLIKNTFNFPIILKPTLGSSSAFVIKVENAGDLVTTYDYIKGKLESIDEYVAEGSDILAEEYIDGDEVDIDLLIQDSEVKFYSITDNHKTREPYFVETGQNIPSMLAQYKQDELYEMAKSTLLQAGVKDGCIHFEAKSNNKGAYPIEVNLRMGGDEVYSFVKGYWETDLAESAVKIALGVPIYVNKQFNPNKCILGKYFLPETSGKLSYLEIEEDIYNKNYIFDFQFFKKLGDEVVAPPEGYDYCGWITVVADNLENAQKNLNEAYSFIKYKIS